MARRVMVSYTKHGRHEGQYSVQWQSQAMRTPAIWHYATLREALDVARGLAPVTRAHDEAVRRAAAYFIEWLDIDDEKAQEWADMEMDFYGLDEWITGHYGEDELEGPEDETGRDMGSQGGEEVPEAE